VPLVDPVQSLKYQEIAAEVVLLRKLGLPVYKIAHTVGVADKTVLRALKWADESRDQPATAL
jgi:predicted transcriptional regulator